MAWVFHPPRFCSSCVGVPEVVPAEVLDPGPLQRSRPGLGIQLPHRLALVREHVGGVLADLAVQHSRGGRRSAQRLQALRPDGAGRPGRVPRPLLPRPLRGQLSWGLCPTPPLGERDLRARMCEDARFACVRENDSPIRALYPHDSSFDIVSFLWRILRSARNQEIACGRTSEDPGAR